MPLDPRVWQVSREELQMAAEAARRQLETIDLIARDEARKLALCDARAWKVAENWGLAERWRRANMEFATAIPPPLSPPPPPPHAVDTAGKQRLPAVASRDSAASQPAGSRMPSPPAILSARSAASRPPSRSLSREPESDSDAGASPPLPQLPHCRYVLHAFPQSLFTADEKAEVAAFGAEVSAVQAQCEVLALLRAQERRAAVSAEAALARHAERETARAMPAAAPFAVVRQTASDGIPAVIHATRRSPSRPKEALQEEAANPPMVATPATPSRSPPRPDIATAPRTPPPNAVWTGERPLPPTRAVARALSQFSAESPLRTILLSVATQSNIKAAAPAESSVDGKAIVRPSDHNNNNNNHADKTPPLPQRSNPNHSDDGPRTDHNDDAPLTAAAFEGEDDPVALRAYIAILLRHCVEAENAVAAHAAAAENARAEAAAAHAARDALARRLDTRGRQSTAHAAASDDGSAAQSAEAVEALDAARGAAAHAQQRAATLESERAALAAALAVALGDAAASRRDALAAAAAARKLATEATSAAARLREFEGAFANAKRECRGAESRFRAESADARRRLETQRVEIGILRSRLGSVATGSPRGSAEKQHNADKQHAAEVAVVGQAGHAKDANIQRGSGGEHAAGVAPEVAVVSPLCEVTAGAATTATGSASSASGRPLTPRAKAAWNASPKPAAAKPEPVVQRSPLPPVRAMSSPVTLVLLDGTNGNAGNAQWGRCGESVKTCSSALVFANSVPVLSANTVGFGDGDGDGTSPRAKAPTPTAWH